jgi:hypothetical protein
VGVSVQGEIGPVEGERVSGKDEKSVKGGEGPEERGGSPVEGGRGPVEDGEATESGEGSGEDVARLC